MLLTNRKTRFFLLMWLSFSLLFTLSYAVNYAHVRNILLADTPYYLSHRYVKMESEGQLAPTLEIVNIKEYDITLLTFYPEDRSGAIYDPADRFKFGIQETNAISKTKSYFTFEDYIKRRPVWLYVVDKYGEPLEWQEEKKSETQAATVSTAAGFAGTASSEEAAKLKAYPYYFVTPYNQLFNPTLHRYYNLTSRATLGSAVFIDGKSEQAVARIVSRLQNYGYTIKERVDKSLFATFLHSLSKYNSLTGILTYIVLGLYALAFIAIQRYWRLERRFISISYTHGAGKSEIFKEYYKYFLPATGSGALGATVAVAVFFYLSAKQDSSGVAAEMNFLFRFIFAFMLLHMVLLHVIFYFNYSIVYRKIMQGKEQAV